MLATLAQLKTRLGIASSDTDNDTELTEILTAIGIEFETYCKRPFELAERTEYPVLHNGSCWIKLMCWPVVTLTSVKIAYDYDFDSADALTADTEYRLIDGGSTGHIYRASGWPATPGSVQVVYTGGYVAAGDTPGEGEEAVPADLREAALTQAALTWKRRDSVAVQSVDMEGATTRYQPVGLTAATRQTLEHYKRYSI
jgi:hypothetical protein